jgi:N-acetylneuraminic acid mutarotase
MGAKRNGHASVVLDGKSSTPWAAMCCRRLTRHDEGLYDPQADSWQQVASMPRGLYRHAAAAMGGKIYVTGGSYQLESVNSVYVYDPQADAWTQLANMSNARQLHASAAVGGKLYVFGGYGAGRGLTEGVSARRRSTTLLRTGGRQCRV